MNQSGHVQVNEISLDTIFEYKANKKQHGYCLDTTSLSGTYVQIVEIECAK